MGFSSLVGEGSKFWVQFPIALDKKSDAIEPASRGAADINTGPVKSDTRSPLYVEDNAANIALMEEIILGIPAVKMTTANDGESGIEIAVKSRPDLILLDINLPGIDGIEVFEQLRGHPATRGIPVIAVSAAAMPLEIQKGMEVGFLKYLTKPFNVAEVEDSIRNSLFRDN